MPDVPEGLRVYARSGEEFVLVGDGVPEGYGRVFRGGRLYRSLSLGGLAAFGAGGPWLLVPGEPDATGLLETRLVEDLEA